VRVCFAQLCYYCARIWRTIFGKPYPTEKVSVVARPKSPTKSVHTAIRLPEEMHRRLAKARRGLAEEIKERLEISFAWERLDEATRILAGNVIGICQLMVQDGHDWRSSPFRRAALSTAIAAWLETQVPGTPSTADAHASEKSSVWLKEGDSPEEAGRALLSLHLFCVRMDDFRLWPDPGPLLKPLDESEKGSR
jgi:hypothetical protein